MAFFRDVFASALNRIPVKIIVLIAFAGYAGMSGWAISNLEEGLERRHLARYDSYSIDFYNSDEMYFKEFSFRINVSPFTKFFVTFLWRTFASAKCGNINVGSTFLVLKVLSID